jgi:hypothetical protein
VGNAHKSCGRILEPRRSCTAAQAKRKSHSF